MGVTCWANCLGDCSPVQSREHYISRGLFDGDSVTLKGLPWCQLEERSIGLASASAKILCKRHNERLSPLDDEAIRAFDALREIFLLQARQKKLGPHFWKVRTFRLNGRLLERWFLKTLINLIYIQTEAVSWPNAAEPRVPTADAVQACFGLCPILSPRGLHAAAALGQRFDSRDNITFSPIKDKSVRALAGGVFEFRGLRFVFAWTDKSLAPFIRLLGDSAPAFAGWRGSDLLHPLRQLNFKVGDRLAQVLKIVWPPFRRDSRWSPPN